MNTFTCFGEVLWDVFPEHKKIGGAPLNVALRIKSFNNDVAIISSTGKDELGEKLTAFLNQKKLRTDHVQTNKSYPTGEVTVILDSKGSASYEIKEPVAWDDIELRPEDIELVKNSDVFIYGSLVCRNRVSRNSLFQLLNYASFKVFDVNLRPPYFTYDLLNDLMMKADFIKFNDEELEQITKNLNSECHSIEDNMTFISKRYNTQYVCVTKGGSGATLLIDGHFYNNSGYKVEVKDTVGAGDSFLGSLIHKIANNSNPQESLDFACAVGALVASAKGANPKIRNIDILNMINN